MTASAVAAGMRRIVRRRASFPMEPFDESIVWGCSGLCVRQRTNEMDRSDKFRQAATRCLLLARKTKDPATRLSLLTMAQQWFTLANGSHGDGAFNAALRIFNDSQMTRQ
jgi:hypothetical protein